jgi:hypothetical protein
LFILTPLNSNPTEEAFFAESPQFLFEAHRSHAVIGTKLKHSVTGAGLVKKTETVVGGAAFHSKFWTIARRDWTIKISTFFAHRWTRRRWLRLFYVREV